MEQLNETFQKDPLRLLNCNRNNFLFKNVHNLKGNYLKYFKSLKNYKNYGNQPTLESWIDKRHIYPIIDPRHRFIVDTIKNFGYKKVIEFGAGSGCVAKHVFKEIENLEKLVCVEHNIEHYKQMLDNFDKRYNVVQPYIKVKAETIHLSIHSLKQFPDNFFDVGYTCTVIMHLPYTLAIPIICEIGRICKHVIHTENENDQLNCIVLGDTKGSREKLLIDYEKLYKELNFDVISHERVKDPYAPCYYRYVHVKKRINNK